MIRHRGVDGVGLCVPRHDAFTVEAKHQAEIVENRVVVDAGRGSGCILAAQVVVHVAARERTTIDGELVTSEVEVGVDGVSHLFHSERDALVHADESASIHRDDLDLVGAVQLSGDLGTFGTDDDTSIEPIDDDTTLGVGRSQGPSDGLDGVVVRVVVVDVVVVDVVVVDVVVPAVVVRRSHVPTATGGESKGHQGGGQGELVVGVHDALGLL